MQKYTINLYKKIFAYFFKKIITYYFIIYFCKMKKPDNVVFNTKKQEHYAYKRQHTTIFNSKNLTRDN